MTAIQAVAGCRVFMPQWSRSRRSGMTRLSDLALRRIEPAAMEPLPKERNDDVAGRPRTGAARAAMEPPPKEGNDAPPPAPPGAGHHLAAMEPLPKERNDLPGSLAKSRVR